MAVSPIKVLLVEDNPTDVLLLQAALDADRLDTFELSSIERLSRVPELLETAQFSLILLDLGLPDSQGLATFETCRRYAPQLPIIVFSGNVDEQAAIEAVRAGAQDYLVKNQLAWDVVPRAIRYAIERYRNQKALRQSEERYFQFISQSFEGIYRTEFDHPVDTSLPVETQIDLIYENAYMAECNQALAEMYRLPSVDALINMRLIDAHGGKDNPTNRAAFRKLIENGYKSVDDETIEYDANGKPVWFLSNTVGTLENGFLVRLWGTAINVTERKLAQMALAENEKRFRALIEHSSDAIVLLDVQGRILYESPALTRITGFSLDERIGRSGFENLYPDDRSTVMAKFVEVISHPGQIVHAAYRSIRKDGSLWWAELTATNMLDEPSVQGIVVNFRDVTERKLAEIALQQSEERHRQISNLISDYVYSGLISPDGSAKTEWVSGAFEKITGYTRDEINLLPAGFSSLVLPEDLTMLLGKQAAFLENRSQTVEYRIRRKDGRLCWMRDYMQLITDQMDDKTIRLIGAVQDITAQKLAEENLYFHQSVLEETGRVAKVGGWSFDVATGDGFWTDEVARIHDLDPALPTSKAIGLRYFTDESRRIAENAIQNAMDTGTPYDLELELVSAKGVHKWIRTIGHPQMEDGRAVRIFGSFQDISDRKEAEKQIRELQEFTSATIDALSAQICVLDEQGAIISVNRAWREFAVANPPVPENCFLDANYLDVCDKAQGEDAAEAIPVVRGLRDVLAGKIDRFQMEYPCHSPTEKRWFVIRVTRFTRNGAVRLAVAHENITERKLVEDAFRQSEARLNTIFHTSPLPIVISRLNDGKYVECNQAFEKLTGYTKSELIGRTAQELKIWTDLELRDRMIDELRAKGAVQQFEFQIKNLSGEYHDLLMSAESVTLDGEAHVLTIAQDITERKRAEMNLKKNERVLRLFVEHSPASIAMFDQEMKYIIASRRYLQDYGLGDQDLTGRSHYEVFPEIGEPLKEIHRRCLAGAIEKADNDPFLRADGHVDWVHWEIHPWYESAEHVGGLILFSEVVTERRKAEQAIVHYSKQLATVAEIESALVASLDQASIYEVLSKGIQQLFQNIVTIFVSSFDAEKELIKAVYGLHDGGLLDVAKLPEIPLAPEGQGTQSQVIRTRQPLIVGSRLKEKLRQGTITRIGSFAEGETQSALYVPMLAQGSVQGLIQLQSLLPERFDEEDARVLSLVANAAAAAIQNARLYELAQKELAERREAEQKLRKSEEQYRYLFENNPHPMWAYDLQTLKFLAVNDAAVEKYGYSRDEFLGMTIIDIRPPEDVQRLLDDVARVRPVLQHSAGWRHKLKNGAIIDVEISSHSLELEGHRSALVVALDVTERKRMLDALYASEAKYRSLIESTDAAIGLLDEKGRYLYINEIGASWYGKKAEDFIGKSLHDLFPEKYKEPVPAEVRQVFVKNKGFIKEISSTFGDGRWFRISVQPVRGQDGKVSQVMLNTVDITENKQAEELVHQRLNQLEVLYENSLSIGSLMDMHQIAEKVIEILGRKLEWHHAIVRSYNQHEGKVEILAFNHAGLPNVKYADHLNELQQRLNEPQKGISGWVLEHGETVLAKDLSQDQRYVVTYPGMCSGLYVPLKVGATIIGSISIESTRLGAFSEDDRRLLETIASQASIAIENAHLYLKVQQELAERQQAQESLHQSERHLRAILQTTSDGFWIVNLSGHFLDVNDSYCQMSGYSRDELLQLSLSDVQVVKTGPEMVERISQISQDDSARFESQHRRKDGSVFDVEIVVNRLDNELICFCHDITKRKQVEQEILQVNERFTEIANNISEIFWIYDPQIDRNIYVSPAFESIVGLSYEGVRELPGGFLAFVLEEDRHILEESYEREALGLEVDVQYRLRRRDGSIRWIRDKSSPVLDKNGRVTHVVGIARDVTDAVEAETRVRESEARFRLIAETIDEVFWMADAQFNTMFYVSPGYERVWGRTPESLYEAPTSFADAVVPDERSKVFDTLKLQRSGVPFSHEYHIQHTDGSIRTIWERGYPVTGEGGQVIRYIGISQDITERKQAESLVFAQRDLSRVVSSVRSVEDGAKSSLEIALRISGLDCGGVYLLGADGRSFELVSHQGLGAGFIEAIAYRPLNNEDARFVLAGNILISDAEELAQQEIFRSEKLSALVGVPIRYQEHVIGYLGAASHTLLSIPDFSRQALETIAIEIGNIITFLRAEMSLRLSEERYRSLAEASDAIIVMLDADGRMHYLNDKAMHSQEYSGKDPIGKTLHELLPNAVADYFLEKVKKVISSSQGVVFESQSRSIWYRISVQPIYDDGGKVIMALMSATDITLLKTAQHELLELNQTLERRIRERTAEVQDLYENAPTGYHSLDADGKFILINQTELTWLGYSRDEVIGQSFTEFVTPASIKVFQTNFPVFKKRGWVRNLEFELVRKDGSTFPVLVSATIVKDGAGNYLLSRSTVFDNTERKQAEIALRESEEQNRLLFEESPDAVILLDDTDRIKRLNHAFELLAGIPREKFIDHSLREMGLLFQGGVEQLGQATLQSLQLVDNFASTEFKLVQTDGSIHDLGARVFALKIQGQQHFLTTMRDITAEKKAEEALRFANAEMGRALRLKDEFLANMSHELRTPLNAILGISESLEEQVVGPLNEKQQHYIRTVSESGRHLLALINDILDLSKIEAGRMDLSIGQVNVGILVQSSLRMIKELAQKKNLNVDSTIDSQVLTVQGDERRLKQVLVNLLSNAVKFTPERGEIGLEVSGDLQNEQVIFTVWDKGIGIEMDDIPRLFQPFVQLDSGLAREHAGTGLGLALVSEIVRLHGGRVGVQSKPGEGSRFFVILPWRQEQENPAARKAGVVDLPIQPLAPTAQAKRGKILLVEDTESITLFIGDYLQALGYQVTIARDGLAGVGEAKSVHPDLILMDIQMPGLNGFDATREIRSDPALAQTPIIALTAMAMPGDRERCLAAGMQDYLSKPISLKEMAKVIHDYLSKPGEKSQ